MPNASSLFHDTLLNKINDLIKLHVRFIDKKIRKQKKTLTAINVIKSVSMRKPGRTRQEVIQLKSPILLKLGINVGFGE